MRASRLGVLALVLAFASSGHAEDLPAGRFGVVTTLRQNLGELGDSYGRGILIGVEAGYIAPLGESRWGIGPVWSTLFRGWYFADQPTLVERSVSAAEMSFGLRARRMIGDAPRFVFADSGVTLLRTEIPVPPSDERLYLGPYVGVGYEQFVLGRGFLALEARADMLVGGPPSLSLFLSFSAGSVD